MKTIARKDDDAHLIYKERDILRDDSLTVFRSTDGDTYVVVEGKSDAGTAGAPGVACPEPGCGYVANSDHGLRIHRGRMHKAS